MIADTGDNNKFFSSSGGAGLIGTAAEIGYGFYENYMNRKFYEEQQGKQNNFNAEQAQISYDRQRDLLKYQNEYDTPVNQMQRYKAAGLNPALLASNVTAQGTSAPSVDSTSAAAGPSVQPYTNVFQGGKLHESV